MLCKRVLGAVIALAACSCSVQGLSCYQETLSVDGRSFDVGGLGAQAGTGRMDSNCLEGATHCLHLSYVQAYDAQTGSTTLGATGMCYYPDDSTWSSHYAAADSNSDGSISSFELSQYTSNTGTDLSAMDSDSDGSISADEFHGYFDSQTMLRSKGVRCDADTVTPSGHAAIDGSFAFACCTGDNCNDPSEADKSGLATLAASAGYFLSLPDCSTPEATTCANKYASAYGCRVTHIPLPPDDACAPYVWGNEYSCLARTACTCGCSKVSHAHAADAGNGTTRSLTPCERLICIGNQSGWCAPGCQFSQLSDGVCDGLCMNSFCDFDGGDCLDSAGWHASLTRRLKGLDRNGDGRVQRSEYDETSSYYTPWFHLDLAPWPSLTWCQVAGAGAGVSDLSLAAMAHDGFPNHAPTTSSLMFGLAPHPQLDTLKTALYIVGSADSNLDGSLSFEEARRGYRLTWDEYTFVNTLAFGASEVEGEEIASMLSQIVDTLRGYPWPDRDSFYGADVAAAAAVKMLSRCQRGALHQREAQAMGVTERGFFWADVDGDGLLAVAELLSVLQSVHAGGAAIQVSSVHDRLGAQLGMPGFRAEETRWLVLPDWHYELPFSKAALEDAGVCTHSDARIEEIRRHLFHKNRLTPRNGRNSRSQPADRHASQGASPSTRHANRARLSSAVTNALASGGSEETVRRAAQHVVAPRLSAMMRSRAGERLEQLERPERQPPASAPGGAMGGAKRKVLSVSDAQGSGGAAGSTRAVEELAYPFVVSLEKPSCSFEDMLLDALEEGKYKLHDKAAEEERVKAFRDSMLRSKGGRARSRSRPRARAPTRHTTRSAHADASAGSGRNASCEELLDFMASDVVMLALDHDGDGSLSWSETCLSKTDFVAAAQLCAGCGDLMTSFSCVSAGASGYDSTCGFVSLSDEAIDAAYAQVNISKYELDAYLVAYSFHHLDASPQDGILDISSTHDVQGESTLLDEIASDLKPLYERTASATGSYLDFDVTDGLTIEEYQVVTRLLRLLYGTDLDPGDVDQRLETLVRSRSLRLIPEPFFSTLQNLTGHVAWYQKSDANSIGENMTNHHDAPKALSADLATVLRGLTHSLRRAAGCEPGDSPVGSQAGSGTGIGTGSGSGGGGSARLAPDGYLGFVGNRRRLLTELPSYDNTISWTQYCGATLIHPKWVLTAAGCLAEMDLTRVVNTHSAVLGGHECVNGGATARADCHSGVTRARLARVVLHPLYHVDPAYDVALVELEREVLGFEPAPLDDATDLGFLACKHPNLTAVGWWPSSDSATMACRTPLRQHTLEYVPTDQCKQHYLTAFGFEEVGTHELSICARPMARFTGSAASTCLSRGYFGQDGGPLLVPREGTPDGFVLAGVIRAGVGAASQAWSGESAAAGCLEDEGLPRAHVRVAGVRQWVLAVSALGASVPVKLAAAMESLHLPRVAGASLRIYQGATDEEHALLHTVDYDCGAHELEFSAQSGFLLVLDQRQDAASALDHNISACGQRRGLEEEWGRDCRAEQLVLSLATRNCSFNAAAPSPAHRAPASALAACADPAGGGIEGCFVDADGECRAPACSLTAASWEDLVNMEKIGKAFLGGLGGMASQQAGVWACVRGWDNAEQRRCGLTTAQLACFSYDEAERKFDFLGTNDQVLLVSKEREEEGLARESSLSSLLR